MIDKFLDGVHSRVGDAGSVQTVENFGAGDIIEVQRPSVDGKPGKRFMAPMHAVTLDAERAVIDAAFVE